MIEMQSHKLLILSASPVNTTSLQLTLEIEQIEAAVRRKRIVIETKHSFHRSLRSLRESLTDYQPTIVHFCGHSRVDGLLVEDERTRLAVTVDAKALSDLFEVFAKHVQCVVLNACWTLEQAELLCEHVDCVVGMGGAISDEGAIAFADGFYDAVANDYPWGEAFRLGCASIKLARQGDQVTPQLLLKPGDIPSRARRQLQTVQSMYPNAASEVRPILAAFAEQRFHDFPELARRSIGVAAVLLHRLAGLSSLPECETEASLSELTAHINLHRSSTIPAEVVDALASLVAIERTAVPTSDPRYVANDFGEQFLTFTDWFYSQHGAACESGFVTPSDDMAARPPQRALPDPEVIAESVPRVLYQNALQLFDEGSDESLDRALEFCLGVGQTAKHLSDLIAPLAEQIRFRKSLHELLAACARFDDGACEKILAELGQQRERLEIANDADVEQVHRLQPVIADLVTCRRGLDRLLTPDYGGAHKVLSYTASAPCPAERGTDNDPVDRQHTMIIQVAEYLYDVTTSLRSVAGIDDVLEEVQRLDGDEGKILLKEHWDRLYRSLVEVEGTPALTTQSLKKPDKSVLDALSRLQESVGLTRDLERLIPHVDMGRFRQGLDTARRNKTLSAAYAKFRIRLEADDLAGAQEWLIQEFPWAEEWKQYLDDVSSIQLRLRELCDGFECDVAERLDTRRWAAMDEQAASLLASCAPLWPFWADQLEPERDTIGPSIFVDFDELHFIKRRIVHYQEVCRIVEGIDAALTQLDGLDEAEKLLKSAAAPTAGNEDDGDAFAYFHLDQYREWFEETRQFCASLERIESEAKRLSASAAWKKLEELRPSSANPAISRLLERKQKLSDSIFKAGIELVERVRAVLGSLCKDGLVQEPAIVERPSLCSGYGALFSVKITDLGHVEELLGRLAKPDASAKLSSGLATFLDESHPDTPATLVAMGEHDEALRLVNERAGNTNVWADLHKRGVIHFLASLDASTVRARVQHIRCATACLLPVFFHRESSVVERFVAAPNASCDESLGDAAIEHLRLEVRAAGDSSLTTDFQRDCNIIRALTKLRDQSKQPIGFLNMKEGGRLPVGRALIDELDLWPQVRNEMRAIRDACSQSGSHELRDLPWRLRLLLCKQTEQAVLLYDENHLADSLAAAEQTVSSESLPLLQKSAYENTSELINDLKRLQTSILQKYCLKALQSEPPMSFREVLRWLNPCITIGKELGDLSRLLRPLGRQLKELAENVPEAATLNQKYLLAMLMLEYFRFGQREASGHEIGIKKSEVVDFGWNVSMALFKREIRVLQNPAKGIGREQFEANLSMHARLLQGLELIDGGNAQLLHDLGCMQCMKIVVLKSTDNITKTLWSIVTELESLENKADLHGKPDAAQSLYQMKRTVEQVIAQGDLSPLRRRLLRAFNDG